LINDSGHSFDANAEASKIRKALDVKYNIPLGSPLEDVFSVFGGFEDEKLNETSGLDVNTKTITVGHNVPLNLLGIGNAHTRYVIV